ncbi:hypothetical protein GGR51DRAFT_527417 [Nemania sp. FL0031]|nr:hypothetical protein GGR51DRAFT_527417 [Nemania sp. FL0031]
MSVAGEQLNQNAFATYRCRPGQSRISNPERLKFVVPLFTYSRETLLAWRSRYKDEVGGNMDISAALFAKQVVRFLEGSVDFEAWAPIPDHFNSMEAFEVAKWRFKVALLILWFLEKAFAMPEELGSLGDR